MCGIVGLFLKDEALEPQLGAMTAGMLATMSDRGPDSAGFAVYGGSTPGQVKLMLRGGPGVDFAAVEGAIGAVAGEAAGGAQSFEIRDTHGRKLDIAGWLSPPEKIDFLHALAAALATARRGLPA